MKNEIRKQKGKTKGKQNEKKQTYHANVSFLIDPMALFDCRNSPNKNLSLF